MKTYIITMDVTEVDLAHIAASTLNGQMFIRDARWPDLLDQVSDYLAHNGFPHGIPCEAVEATEYFEKNLKSNNWPSEKDNIYAAAVTVQPPSMDKGCADLLYILEKKVNVYSKSHIDQYVKNLTNLDLQWLYTQNRNDVNRWLADSETDLYELYETGGNIADVVTVLWAKSVLEGYLDKRDIFVI